MSTPQPTAPQPLFDRLLEPTASRPDDTGAGAGLGRLDAPGLQASLAAHLGQLFNTRSRLGVQGYLAQAGGPGLTLLDYGLPDLGSLSPRAEADRLLLAQIVSQCLARFEPRLSHTSVEVLPMPGDLQRMRVVIDAAVALGRELYRVQFDLAADASAVVSTPEPGSGAA